MGCFFPELLQVRQSTQMNFWKCWSMQCSETWMLWATPSKNPSLIFVFHATDSLSLKYSSPRVLSFYIGLVLNSSYSKLHLLVQVLTEQQMYNLVSIQHCSFKNSTKANKTQSTTGWDFS